MQSPYKALSCLSDSFDYFDSRHFGLLTILQIYFFLRAFAHVVPSAGAAWFTFTYFRSLLKSLLLSKPFLSKFTYTLPHQHIIPLSLIFFLQHLSQSNINFIYLGYFLSPVECKLHEGRVFLIFFLPPAISLAPSVVSNKCSIKMYLMNNFT